MAVTDDRPAARGHRRRQDLRRRRGPAVRVPLGPARRGARAHGRQRRRQEHPRQDPQRRRPARRRHDRHPRPEPDRPLARRGPARRDRVRLPGAGPHPRPRHPVEPAADRDRGRALPPLDGRARASKQPVLRHAGQAPPPRHVADHRPGARAGDRARRPDARRDDRRPAGEPHGARARGRRPPARRRALHHLHLPPHDRDRRGLRPGDGPARRRDGRRRGRHAPAPRTGSSS